MQHVFKVLLVTAVTASLQIGASHPEDIGQNVGKDFDNVGEGFGKIFENIFAGIDVKEIPSKKTPEVENVETKKTQEVEIVEKNDEVSKVEIIEINVASTAPPLTYSFIALTATSLAMLF